jgi:hypothetical protein
MAVGVFERQTVQRMFRVGRRKRPGTKKENRLWTEAKEEQMAGETSQTAMRGWQWRMAPGGERVLEWVVLPLYPRSLSFH